MARRLDLQEVLETLAPNVYFQPPASLQMTYPAIVYERNTERVKFADNGPYGRTKRYQVTVIDKNPDSSIPDAVAQLPLCQRQRTFAKDNLNHDVFFLYF